MMSEKPNRPSAKELAELSAYLSAREQEFQPAPGEPSFPTGLAGELLKLSESTEPDPVFASRLEQRLREAARSGAGVSYPNWLAALWHAIFLPERKTNMKRVLAFALVAIILLTVIWVSTQVIIPSPNQTQVVMVTPPTKTPIPTPLSPLTPTAIPTYQQHPVAINFTPRPIPTEPPVLPSLVDALSVGYGGSGAGNLPPGLPLSLETTLPEGPAEITAYYRLENDPLTLEEANQIATQWKLIGKFYMPGWMESVSPDQVQRSYIAVEGMKNLSLWNNELSYTDLSISPVYGGHQYPQAGLPSAEQASKVAIQYLTERGYLDYPYRVDLSNYDYGLVNFYRLLEGVPIDYHAASIQINPQGWVGSAWVNREQYEAIGSYPVVSAQSAWDLLVAGQQSDQLSISYYPMVDGNPQYWGRTYHTGQTAHLFGTPTYLLAAESGDSPYVALNNLILVGDASDLLSYLQSGQGYIHAWGEVQDVNGTKQLQLAGWEPFDEFSGYFDGIVRQMEGGDFLELSDGQQLRLPDLPADVPTDIPVYAQGGLVGDSLEWFILQVHPSDKGHMPPEPSLVQAVIDQVELVYLAPALNNIQPDTALDPAYRMLMPAWSFSGHIIGSGETELRFQAYVQAVNYP